jgi:hypothetical protein
MDSVDDCSWFAQRLKCFWFLSVSEDLECWTSLGIILLEDEFININLGPDQSNKGHDLCDPTSIQYLTFFTLFLSNLIYK